VPRSNTAPCRTGIPGDENGVGGIYNFVTKRGLCKGKNSRITWTQVETGSAITWKYPSCILLGDGSKGEFYSVAVVNNMQQADTGTKMIHIGKNTSSTIVSKGISAGRGQNSYRGLVEIRKSATNSRNFFAVRLDVDRREVRGAHVPLHRSEEYVVERRSMKLRPRRLGKTRSYLQARIGENQILNGIDLKVNAGEVHAIMGPNGSGKSTLASVLAGREDYEVTGGKIDFLGKDLLELSPEDRAREGIFMAFQYPVEIPGVSTINFMKTALNQIRTYRGQQALDAVSFLQLMKEKMKLVEIDQSLLNRSLNEGFSGGEKKRNEIFQMAMLEPKLAILDETDSGLDIDALRIVANGVNKLRNKNNATIVVTHYQRLLDYIVPDYVHVLYKGKIVKSGTKELALELEAKGYDWIKNEIAVA
jgi:Fe-S cluster assembly ATP-binding protein